MTARSKVNVKKDPADDANYLKALERLETHITTKNDELRKAFAAIDTLDSVHHNIKMVRFNDNKAFIQNLEKALARINSDLVSSPDLKNDLLIQTVNAELIRLKVLAEKDADIKSDLNQLKQRLKNVCAEYHKAETCYGKASSMVAEVEHLYRSNSSPVPGLAEGLPTKELTQVLNDTYSVLNGEISPKDYQNIAKAYSNKWSVGNVAAHVLGGLMVALGAAIALSPLFMATALTAHGLMLGVLAGAGIQAGGALTMLAGAGVTFFTKGPTDELADSMQRVSAHVKK